VAILKVVALRNVSARTRYRSWQRTPLYVFLVRKSRTFFVSENVAVAQEGLGRFITFELTYFPIVVALETTVVGSY
jgi:hypothetical protein